MELLEISNKGFAVFDAFLVLEDFGVGVQSPVDGLANAAEVFEICIVNLIAPEDLLVFTLKCFT